MIVWLRKVFGRTGRFLKRMAANVPRSCIITISFGTDYNIFREPQKMYLRAVLS